MIMKNGTKGIHRLLGLLLALTMLLSLVAPVLNVAYAQPDEGIGSESVEEAAEEQVPEPHEEEALPVEDTETEEQEEETEPDTEWEEPVSETEEDVTPDPETEDETEEPDVTEDAVEEEEETEEATEEDEEGPEEHPGENPDHVVPDDSPYGGEINYGIYPETPFGRFPFALNRNMFNMAHISPTEPGEVTLSKVATPVDGMVNTWDVTLRIEGKDKPTTSDIVLVIDTSGSMNDYGRMAAAKAAANKFVDALLPSDNTRIGVVSFASTANTRQALTNNATNLHAAINALTAGGGTFTQAGVKQAQALLDNSDADNKHIVLLSDGEPTYSYGIRNPNDYSSLQYIEGYASPRHWVNGNRWATTSNVPESQFTGTTVGDGTQMFHRYYNDWGTSNDRYYNHGNSAIAQAGFAKANSRVWTIALSVSTAGQEVLDKMASPNSYFTAEPADLETIFQNIAGQIGSAVKEATVSDAMGGGFYIPGGVDSVTVSQGSVTSTNGTLNWNPGTLTVPIETGSDIRFAEMTYRVEINDDILNQTPDEEGKYPTNSLATINYTDADGNPASGTFPVPMVDPIFLSVAKVLKDDQGNIIEDDERTFDINITNNNGYNHTYSVKAGETIWLTNLRLVDTYTVTELGAEDYEPIIVINGNETNTFTVNQGDPDIKVVVTNKKPTVKVEGKKTWDDMDNQDGKRPESIMIRLIKTVGDQESEEVEAKEIKADDGWEWSFTDLPKYEGGYEITYTITEDPIDGYTTEVNGYDVTNTHVPSKININVEKVWKNTSTYPESVTIKLLADGVDTGKTLELTADADGNWKGTFEDLDEYSNGKKIEYTIEEVKVENYETTITGDAEKGFVVTNTRIFTPPTGINLDFLPYVLLLAVAGVGIGATTLRKRKNEA